MSFLIRHIVVSAFLALGLAWVAIAVLGDLSSLGESRLQVIVVLTFYVYCAIVLFIGPENKLFHILSIPFLTQFLHLFQKYAFPAGANSMWRLLPFILVDIYLGNFALRRKSALTLGERFTMALWVLFNFWFMAISPNLEGTYIGGFLLFLVTIPLYFCYLRLQADGPDFKTQLERYLFWIFLLLGLGTVGLVFAGASYKGSDNLLVTRNISDTNVTMAYFILLWPFTMLFNKRSGNMLMLTSMAILFAGIVTLSFSRGALFIVAPYIACSLLFGCGWKYFVCIGITFTGIYLAFDDIIQLVNADLAYSWQLRLGELQSMGNLLGKLQEASGRADLHRLAMDLFLESPLYGHGIASFEALGPGYREAHSMYFTILAEQGMLGIVFMYGLILILAKYTLTGASPTILLALTAYLVFVHSVGYVFVIIPSKSLTINCIAPILLICIYHYACSNANPVPGCDHG